MIAQRAGGDARNALEHPRADRRDGARRGRRRRGAPRRRRGAQAAARLRQGRRPPLRLHLGVDQVDARERRAGVGLLPRRDARGRRGRALHRAADDRARLRGHRQRRPAGAARRGRRGAGRRARRPARGAPQPRAGRGLPRARTEVERVVRRARRARREDVRERGHLLPPAALRSAAYPGAQQARARRGLRLPARRPGGLRGRLPAGGAAGDGLLRAVGHRRRAAVERRDGARV